MEAGDRMRDGDGRPEALDEVIAERNRLWAELQQRNSVEADLAYWRGRAEGMEASLWWRAGRPLRLLKRVVADPAAAFDDAAATLRERRRRRP